MKIEFDKKKTAEALSGALQKTADFSKKTASTVQSKATAMVEQSKVDSRARRLKKYNPLFPEQFHSPDFHLPNMIVIVDDAIRRGIDVCEGAIGWLGTSNGLEILYLYDEFVPASSIKFIPAVTCDAAYYVDNFDRTRFIRIDHIFGKALEEKIAELKYIAYALGAKRCSIEISESSSGLTAKNKSFGFSGKANSASANASSEQHFTAKEHHHHTGKIEAEFEGNNQPHHPELKWFTHDDTITHLIEMRCSKQNTLKSEELILSGSSSATISRQTARAIDGAFGKSGNLSGHSSIEEQAAREQESKMYYHIEF